MNRSQRGIAVLALVLVATMLGGMAQLGRVASAQDATPVAAAQTWQVLVNNVSPEGANWSFNAFYPDHLRAHPGDTIQFTLAPNPTAYHAVQIIFQPMTPMELYQGFVGGFRLPGPGPSDRHHLPQAGAWQSTYFGADPRGPCGRVGQDPCPVAQAIGVDLAFGVNSGILVNAPPAGGEGNTSFTVTLDAQLPLGTFYVMDVVNGPTMHARIDVVAPDQPVQAASELADVAQRQYDADFAWLAGFDRVSYPAEASNPDGTKTWQAAAGVSSPDKPWLSINAFSPPQMIVTAGDTVTWTNQGSGAVAHTVTGFAATPDGIPQNMSPYEPGCLTGSGQLTVPPAGTLPTDVWNTCVGSEVNSFTEFSEPSAPSGDPYVDGPRTSGILLNAEYLDSPVAEGLPYPSSYSVAFPNTGTYTYECAIHPGMTGTVIVNPKPMPL